jgi:Tfp pilus assembly protein PilF
VTIRPIGLFLILTSLLVVGCAQDPSVRKQKYLESGNEYFAEGKYPHAIIEYRNAVDIDPKFGEARKRLAQAYGRTGTRTPSTST